MSAGFDVALRHGFMPEQVVILTDGAENRGSYARAVQAYQKQSGMQVHTVVIETPAGRRGIGYENVLSTRIAQAGLRVDTYRFEGDYNVFDNVIALLGGPSALTLIDQILDTALPYRI